MAVDHHGAVAMILLNLLGLVSSFFASVAPGDTVVSRVVIQQQLVIGVPVRPQVSRPIEWEEKKGPRCIPARAIAGALLSSEKSIDFIMADRSRIRAKLDGDCPALDYYDRFYLQPDDGMVCAGRDMIRSRIGGVCQIDRFKLLRPKVKN